MCKKNNAIDEWNELDNAAKANLNREKWIEFLRYKERLKNQGHKWTDDAEEILRGYIWDAIE